PVLVQGDGAAEQVAGAIRGFNSIDADGAIPRPDLLIVARGGGSLEDLWSFNEEVVVRAVADSDIPLISAVGHETDTTLIDYASDVRAPTPTAAAEYAVPVRDDLIYTLRDFDNRLHMSLRRSLQDKAQRLEGLSRGLPKPSDMLALGRQRFDDLSERLPRALRLLAERRQMKLEGVGRLLRPDLLRRDIERGQEKTQQLSRQLPRALQLLVERRQEKLEGVRRLLRPDFLRRDIERGQEKTQQLSRQLPRALLLLVERRQEKLDGVPLRPDFLRRDIAQGQERIEQLAGRLNRTTTQNLQQASHKFEGAYRLFDSLNYKRVLDRGFAVIRDDRGRAVTQAAALASGDGLDMEFSDGHVTAMVTAASPRKKTPPKKKIKKNEDRQGTLL
ncbi:MAG: exodeoxyribonuclease VII large subunit, partial [Emcibacter sp.]|nr:exodeoxyribonuclease VII large subunit [Emcibacter sp.]